MKTKLFLLSLLGFLFVAQSCTKDENLNKAATANETELGTLMSYDELVAIVGAENIVVEGGQIDKSTPIYMLTDEQVSAQAEAKSQCGNDVPPCASINGIVNSQFAPIADECCCVFAAGTICCGQSGNLLAVLVLVTPRDPNCGS